MNLLVKILNSFSPGKAVGNMTKKYLLNEPSKLVKPLGPVAPLAEIWMVQRLPVKIAAIMGKASKAKQVIDDVEEQKKKLQQVKNIYRDQASMLNVKAAILRK